MSVRAIVLSGYGFNSDPELAEAFRMAGAAPVRLHLSDLLADPALLSGASIVALPGGFSFGDHLGSAQVVANLLRTRLAAALSEHHARGGLTLGICNGFQALVKSGFLPWPESGERSVTLVHNESGRFVDDWVRVSFDATGACAWTRGLSPRELPVRHGEGRFVARDAAVLERLEREGLVALRYEGRNPNGSTGGIAGLRDPSGRVIGLMPHPEAFLAPENHPGRRRGFDGGTGLAFFENSVKAAAAAL
ncbi:MAG: phosphoribosylformylglycinamidine synthase subunit PurQ [Spirochaetales bacterium]|nr:phosphoribosylformylglycinamidine synthase subunit PurQ [Spirochaetales bacterium]